MKVWNSLISKNLAHYSLEKVLFKADFCFLHDRNPKANTTNTPNYESSCEKVTGSNVLKGGLGGGCPPPTPTLPQEPNLFC